MITPPLPAPEEDIQKRNVLDPSESLLDPSVKLSTTQSPAAFAAVTGVMVKKASRTKMLIRDRCDLVRLRVFQLKIFVMFLKTRLPRISNIDSREMVGKIGDIIL